MDGVLGWIVSRRMDSPSCLLHLLTYALKALLFPLFSESFRTPGNLGTFLRKIVKQTRFGISKPLCNGAHPQQFLLSLQNRLEQGLTAFAIHSLSLRLEEKRSTLGSLCHRVQR